MELGPKDLAGEGVVLVRRDTGAKAPVPWADVAAAVPRLLKTIHVGGQTRASLASARDLNHLQTNCAQQSERALEALHTSEHVYTVSS